MKWICGKVLRRYLQFSDRAMVVFYEDLCGGEDALHLSWWATNPICDFLDVKPTRLTTAVAKSCPRLKEWVENWKELKSVGRPYVERYKRAFWTWC